MSAFDSRPTTRGDRMETSKKHLGTDCPHALRRRHREGERERWGYHPVRPVETIDVRSAYAFIAELEDEAERPTKVPAVVEFTPQMVQPAAAITTDFAAFMAANENDVADDDYMSMQDYFVHATQVAYAPKKDYKPFKGSMMNGCFICS